MVLLDVGANVDCKPEHLFQFGILGEVLARDVLQLPDPRVGLLSIGEEEGKGNTQVKETFDLLKTSDLRFVGNVEGRDVFTGDVDVVVCDGFVGNVALKLAEGLASNMATVLKRELMGSWLGKLGTFLAKGTPAQVRPVRGLRRIRRGPSLGPQGHRHRLPRGLQPQGHMQRGEDGGPVRRKPGQRPH